jgi:hypothetical protein
MVALSVPGTINNVHRPVARLLPHEVACRKAVWPRNFSKIKGINYENKLDFAVKLSASEQIQIRTPCLPA